MTLILSLQQTGVYLCH